MEQIKVIDDRKTHFYYIDYLRILGMICVVFLHVAGVTMNRSITALDFELFNVMESIVYAAVPVFFMISGYLVLTSERTTDIAILLKKRLPRLIVPLAGWSLVTAIWQSHLADDYTINGIITRFLPFLRGPVTVHFWFMYTLIALYAISPVLYGVNRLGEKGILYILVIILLLNVRWIIYPLVSEEFYNTYLKINLLDEMQLFGGNIGSFILGWYFGKIKKRIPNFILFAVAFLFLLIIILGSRNFYFINGTYDSPYHSETYGFEIGFSICLFLLFKQNCNHNSRLLRVFPAANLTFPIYLMHVITMELLFGFGFTPNSFLGAFIFSIVNYVLCFFISRTLASIKPLCYLSTGMKLSEASGSCNWFYKGK